MDLKLNEKRAVVCGSSQGIGKAIANELAMHGANITVISRNPERLESVISELDTAQGQKHTMAVADFVEPKQVETAVSEFIESGNRADILINNTGGPPGGQAIDADPAEFISAFKNHLICNQILVQALVPAMKKNTFGRIINIISTSVKQPIPGLGVSNTIRGAVANWAKTLAFELGPFGITVNNLLPGMTQTVRLDSIIKNKAEKSGKSIEQITELMKAEIPVGRIAAPEEIAAAVAFLASPAAGYINGINLPVDGGRTACL